MVVAPSCPSNGKEVKMIITGGRRRKLDRRLKVLTEGTRVIPGVVVDETKKNILLGIGFTEKPEKGETVLPPSDLGPVCKFNAEGKYIIHRKRPMETVYRQIEWTWEQWAGYMQTETHSKIVDVPYKRYPRTLVPPPSVELSITENAEGKKYVVAPEHEVSFQEPSALIHSINVFLEIFSYCEILSEGLEGYLIRDFKRLNWRILPPGKWPWKRIEKELEPLVKRTSTQNQTVIKYRIKKITSFGPQFTAIGQAGFSGYVIFGFPKKNLYVLESLYSGNATYVFEEKWEELSKLTKAEILQRSLQRDRIIHRKNWGHNIDRLIK